MMNFAFAMYVLIMSGLRVDGQELLAHYPSSIQDDLRSNSGQDLSNAPGSSSCLRKEIPCGLQLSHIISMLESIASQ